MTWRATWAPCGTEETNSTDAQSCTESFTAALVSLAEVDDAARVTLSLGPLGTVGADTGIAWVRYRSTGTVAGVRADLTRWRDEHQARMTELEKHGGQWK